MILFPSWILGAAYISNPYLTIASICVATAGLYSFSGPYWALTTSVLTAEVAAVGLGMIGSIGNLGGFVGPYVFGYLKDAKRFLWISVLSCNVALNDSAGASDKERERV